MKLLSYRDCLKKGEKAINEAMIPSKVKKAKKQAELEMCKLEEQLASNETKLQKLCHAEEVDFKKIIELQDEIGLTERRLKQYKKILEEMFPED